MILAEKFPGATDAMLAALRPGKQKVVEVLGLGDHDYDPLRSLVRRFIPVIRTYLSGFRKVRYRDELLTGTLAGGRLDVRGTIKLRISGKGHRLAYRKSQITSDLPYNVCIYAALMQVERLAKSAAIPPSEIAMARALRAPLADCEKSVSRLNLSQLKALAKEQAKANSNSRSEIAVPIELALTLLEATPDETNEGERIDVSRSWFVNLENLFEVSLRDCIRRQLQNSFRVTSPSKRPDLFQPSLGRYRANPDVVVKDGDGDCVMIVDAKYKDIAGWPSASDIHELLAHAAGYHAPRAVIFYPSDAEFRVMDFGTSVTGCRVIAVGIRFNHFEQDISHGLTLSCVFEASPPE
ncbi:hypothetical protein FS764_19285 [Agrobacterium vitis]|uniref:McrC family protein n=1 Tax=Agrobacterium vitis TaxID=373 RepID=UPI001F22341C|nr:McrC family protein [Agrobacterium vitis]MCF1469049.1 hypothetical protein [Agrobacterium vitis]